MFPNQTTPMNPPLSEENCQILAFEANRLVMEEQAYAHKMFIDAQAEREKAEYKLQVEREKAELKIQTEEKIAQIRMNAIISKQSLTTDIELNVEGFPLITRERLEENPIKTYLVSGRPHSYILVKGNDIGTDERILYTRWIMNNGAVKDVYLHSDNWNGKRLKTAMTRSGIKINADRDIGLMATKLLNFLLANSEEIIIPACYGWHGDQDCYRYYPKNGAGNIWKEEVKKCHQG